MHPQSIAHRRHKSGQGNSIIGIFVSIGTETLISGESCRVKNSQPIVLLSLTFASLAEPIGFLARMRRFIYAVRNFVVVYSSLSNSGLESEPKISVPAQKIVEPVEILDPIEASESIDAFSKPAIRSSLKASTCDSVFAALFGGITGGALLSNFLLELGASTVEIGILSSVPMLVNLLQPLGAYLSGRSSSRFQYGLSIFGPSRLLWLILVLGIWFSGETDADKHNLLRWTLGIVFTSNVLSALGCPSWLSWMAAIVPRKLRGRYFGLRNSAASLTALISIPLLSFFLSTWPGGTLEGYGILLLLAVVVGLLSLGCQSLMVDVNPQEQEGQQRIGKVGENIGLSWLGFRSALNSNFAKFLIYFGFWTFAANLSSPFFNLYLLDDLGIDITWVTIYNSLSAGANLLMLVFWGKLADRIGNRPILLLVGILVAVTPLFWLGTSHNMVSVWLWLPLLHLLSGGTWAAIDLCSNNIQMSIAPTRDRATYFAIAAAVAGVGGALATIAGGFVAEFAHVGGLPGLFALSAILRLVALLPLVLVRENSSHPIDRVIQSLRQFSVFPRSIAISKTQLIPILVKANRD